MKHRDPERQKARSAILVAVLLSVLLHQLLIAVIGHYLSITDEEPDQRHEVLLVESPPPQPKEQPPAPESELPTPPSPARAEKPLPVPRPAQPLAQAIEPPQATTIAPPPQPLPEPVEPAAPPKLKLKMGWSGFEATFEEQAKEQRQAYAELRREQRSGTAWSGRITGKVRRAMQSNRPWVKPGNQEKLGKRQRAFRNYIEVVHDTIHHLFADSFLGSLSNLAVTHPLNDFSLHALLEFEITSQGKVDEVRLLRSSGNTVFDAAAIDSVYRSSPHPPPSRAILSWNNRVYMRWGFYRNRRKCGVFNAEPYILRAPGGPEQPIPLEDLVFDNG